MDRCVGRAKDMKHHERRREARLTPVGLRARVRPGHPLAIVNVSADGALVEAGCQLRPGSRIDVHLERDDERRLLGAMVSRCSVAAIDARDGILQADQNLNGGANFCAIWTVFARHGMGVSASGNDGRKHTAASDVPPGC